MKDMGMTDKQFNGFIRFLLDDLMDIIAEMEDCDAREKLEKVADNLKRTLED